jgi:hypothetical protein
MKQDYFIGGLGLFLAGVLAWELAASPEPDAGADQRPGDQRPGDQRPVAATPVVRPGSENVTPEPELTAAATIAEGRPLFSHDRRPGDAGHKVIVAAGTSDTLPRLSGVIVGPHGHRALFTDAAGKSRGATEGDPIGPYVVRVIQPGIVVLLGPEGERVLYTSFAKLPGAIGSGSNTPGTEAPGAKPFDTVAVPR